MTRREHDQAQPGAAGTRPRGGVRFRAALAAAAPSLLAGAALGVTAVELVDPGRVGRLAAAALGAGYALVVLGLVRTFPVARAALPLAGLVVGPLPFTLLVARSLPRDERIAIAIGLALLGALLGALEAAGRGAER